VFLGIEKHAILTLMLCSDANNPMITVSLNHPKFQKNIAIHKSVLDRFWPGHVNFGLGPGKKMMSDEMAKYAPDLRNAWFEVFTGWLYTGEFRGLPEAKNQYLAVFLMLYTFAYEENIALLRDDIMTEFVHLENKDPLRSEPCIMYPLIFLPLDSMLSKFLAQLYGRELSEAVIQKIEMNIAPLTAKKKFTKMVRQERLKAYKGHDQQSTACAFHEHPEVASIKRPA